MAVTITHFRRDLFSLADAALNGEKVEFVHKGVRVRLVPERVTSIFDRITPLQVTTDPDDDIRDAKKALLDEMQREWEKDWADL